MNTTNIPLLVSPKSLEPLGRQCATKPVFLKTGVIKIWASKVATTKCEPALSKEYDEAGVETPDRLKDMLTKKKIT